MAFRLPLYGARNKCVFGLNYYLFRVDWLTNAAMRYVQCDHEVVRLCLLALQDRCNFTRFLLELCYLLVNNLDRKR
jgi:hypothetical protein